MKALYFLFTTFLITSTLAVQAQTNFQKTGDWLDNNVRDMGGRAILMVYHNGQVVYTHSSADMNLRQKMASRYIARKQGNTANTDDYTPTTRLPIASCSKWLSAALIMTFVDEGKLKLSDTVGKFLPVLSQHGKGMITIEDCLSHRTAIKAPELRESLQETRNEKSMDEAIGNIATMPMEGEPGKVFHYSNVGLQIAASVIEKIGGKGFETLFEERIAGPLNMKNTDFGHKPVVLPAGGAQSTPQDYLNFLVMIMNRGTYNGKHILSENAIAQMQRNRLTPDVKIAYSPAEAKGFGYAIGEWTMGNSTVSSPGLFGTFPWVNNDKRYAAILFSFNVKNTGRNARYTELMKLVDEATGQ